MRQNVADRVQQQHGVSSHPKEDGAHEPNHLMDQNHPEPLVAQPDSLPRQAHDTAYLVPADLAQSPCKHKAGKLVDTKVAARTIDWRYRACRK